MAESKDIKNIKKKYGENFMKLCRELFPTLLEKEDLLYEVLSSTFSENCKTLYEDIKNAQLENDFKNYIYSKIDIESQEKEIVTNKTPYELLEEVRKDMGKTL